MDSAMMYRVIQGYLRRLPGVIKQEMIEDGSEIECCVYTPHSLRTTTMALLLDDGVYIKKAHDLFGQWLPRSIIVVCSHMNTSSEPPTQTAPSEFTKHIGQRLPCQH